MINQPLKLIQNFEEFLSKCSNNHLKEPEGNFLEFDILLLFYLKYFGSTNHRNQ